MQVIAEDVAAVIINCGPVPPPAQPGHRLPAFPDCAATNHDANDDRILHETREFWGRLQPQSLVPLLQTASSKGKGLMSSSFVQIQRPSSSKQSHPQTLAGGSSSRGEPGHRDSELSPRDGILLTSSSQSGPRDSMLTSSDSNASSIQQDGSGHWSKDAVAGNRTVHFDLPSSSDSSSGDEFGPSTADTPGGKGSIGASAMKLQSAAEGKLKKSSPPVDVSFR